MCYARVLRRRYLRASTVGPCTSDISDVSYYGYMPFSRQLRDIESSIRDRRRATSTLPPPVSTYWRAFSSPYSRDSKARGLMNRIGGIADRAEGTRIRLGFSWFSEKVPRVPNHVLADLRRYFWDPWGSFGSKLSFSQLQAPNRLCGQRQPHLVYVPNCMHVLLFHVCLMRLRPLPFVFFTGIGKGILP